MKRLAHTLAIPSIICFIALLLWGEHIKKFNALFYFLMFVILGVGFIAVRIQTNRDQNDRIAHNAVRRYKRDNGIPE